MKVIIINSNTSCIEVYNASASKMFGFSSADVIGKNVSVLLPDGISKTTEITAAHKDGYRFPVSISTSEAAGEGKIFFENNVTHNS